MDRCRQKLLAVFVATPTGQRPRVVFLIVENRPAFEQDLLQQLACAHESRGLTLKNVIPFFE